MTAWWGAEFALAPQARVAGFVLVAARVVPCVFLLPAFGAPALPRVLRIALSLAVSAWLCLGLSVPAAPVGGAVWFIWLLRELAVGFTLGWLGAVVFRAVEMAGQIVDLSRRTDGATEVDPAGPGASSATPLSALYALLAVVLFAELGGPAHVIAAFVRSYEVLPLFASRPVVLPMALVVFVARVVAGVIEAAVGLAAPALLAVWLSEVAVVFVARLISGADMRAANLVRLSSPMAGLAMVLLTLGVLRAGIEGWIGRAPALLVRAVTLWVGR